MDPDEIKRRFPNASRSVLEANRPLPDAQPQRDQAKPLAKAVPGEKESVRRVTVRFVGYRVRPLDPDNFAGSCKDLLDGLRHVQMLRGDEWWRINFETAQEKVRHFKQERTEIIITYP